MKYLIILFISIATFANAQKSNYELLSEKVVGQFNKGEFQEISNQIDTALFKRGSASNLEKSWEGVTARGGQFVKILKSEIMEKETFAFVNVLCQFQKNEINIRFTWNTSNKITILSFAPVDKRPKYVVAPYCNPAAAVDKSILMIDGKFRIPGTLSIPNVPGKHPLVILIHGSGPNDRDESFGPLKPFKDLTCGFTSKGIAVLRFEKRTRIFRSLLDHELPAYTLNEEVMKDVKNAIAMAKQDTTIDTTRIFLCGHSFGGMILPRIVKENPGIKGLIFLTPNGQKLEDSFYAQAQYLANEMKDASVKKMYLDSAKASQTKIKSITMGSEKDSSKIFDSPTSWWYEIKDYDQIGAAKSLSLQMLFVFGGRDYQVTSTDAELWTSALKANKNVQFKKYPKLNHFFIAGEGKSLPAEYEKPANVDIGMINDIVTWIKAVK